MKPARVQKGYFVRVRISRYVMSTARYAVLKVLPTTCICCKAGQGTSKERFEFQTSALVVDNPVRGGKRRAPLF